ncbi:glycoside hydrolase family protein [Sinomicrobium soli]|uniref:glycoside hydrolase family protein n=1 Tax=Sinomicrobium sp. N-1-3-6 TaxID=2219864 RepID=UPI000DCF5BD8|nr:glycoside hydrolase family protein [Sinomicrobium sp. N-1-3-6]RAV28134.1 glycosyl hydrolase family 43 [Sinomicrobium sp. N-1-3-6]
MTREEFLQRISLFSAGVLLPAPGIAVPGTWNNRNPEGFAERLIPVGRRLQLEGYYVWCNSPIQGDDGKIHVFFSRWKAEKSMSGWIRGSEVCHAVADHPEAPFRFMSVVLAPRGGNYWDATTCHNPHIRKVDGKYCLFFMGNSNGKTNTKRIGLATSDSLYGPWKRPDRPLLEAGEPGAWDDHCTTNPSFIKHPNGEYWLFYKSWNTAEYRKAAGKAVRGNRKYGLAIGKTLEGPYVRYENNPVVDFSGRGDHAQFEDAFIWYRGDKFRMLARDMGVFGDDVGLYMESDDGIHWGEPSLGYKPLKAYIREKAAPSYLRRYGRMERPQLLFLDGKPAYLFTAAQGGRYGTSTAVLLKIAEG